MFLEILLKLYRNSIETLNQQQNDY